MNLLLHACCGPCALKCAESLKSERISPTLFYFNPNIHPFTEYQSRRDSLLQLANRTNTPAIIHGEYGLRDFLSSIPDFDNRCDTCYQIRLDETAKYAKENGFEAFTTTLLISPYQNHEKLKKSGETAALKVGIPFLYRDFRPLFRQGQQAAREMGLYMQKYCGCVFSEEERYRKQSK
jgi:Uncharacterized protein conserved in bacteria